MRHTRRSGIVGYGIPAFDTAVPPKKKGAESLEEGARGAEVSQWQIDVNEAIGSRLVVDGVFGSLTRAATTKFQRSVDLPDDGVVNDKTTEAMERVLAKKAMNQVAVVHAPPFPGTILKQGSQGRDVRRWQVQIRKLGSELAVDGIFGAETDSVCRNFQAAHQLLVDGEVGPKTWEATFAGSPA
jgi:peptidoglycan hydrolase-like protein with peptidoglycan-binding domain